MDRSNATCSMLGLQRPTLTSVLSASACTGCANQIIVGGSSSIREMLTGAAQGKKVTDITAFPNGASQKGDHDLNLPPPLKKLPRELEPVQTLRNSSTVAIITAHLTPHRRKKNYSTCWRDHSRFYLFENSALSVFSLFSQVVSSLGCLSDRFNPPTYPHTPHPTSCELLNIRSILSKASSTLPAHGFSELSHDNFWLSHNFWSSIASHKPRCRRL